MTTGTLSLVATPIGNLEDMTHRAVRVLSEADYILCEDTRVTGKLRERYYIKTALKRYDAHATEATMLGILADLAEDKRIALVSDAGTPGVSDPGVLLVQRARAANVHVEVVPGPSAVTAAVSLAGFTGNQFSFLGFVPQKKGRQRFFEALATFRHPVLFFESTHRILKTLISLNELYPEHTVAYARELTKLFEEYIAATPAELIAHLEAEPNKQKGEFVVIFYPQDKQ